MYPQSEIQDIIDNLNHGMTVRGNLVAECIMFNGKNIENRTRKIKHKYVALHLGTGRITKDVERHLLANIKERKDYKLKKGHIVAILKMGEAKHLSELNEEEQKNKWVWRGGKYDVSNFIEKVYILKNPIKSRGFQCQTWKLECVDNTLKKKNKFQKPIKGKIVEELHNITQHEKDLYEMIGQDCVDIIEEYKIDMEKYENDIHKIDECIENIEGERKNKVFKVDLTLGEIKSYYEEQGYYPEIQVKIEIHYDAGVSGSSIYDAYLWQDDINGELNNIRVYALWNSYVSKIICFDLGEYNEEDYISLMDDKIGCYIIENESDESNEEYTHNID